MKFTWLFFCLFSTSAFALSAPGLVNLNGTPYQTTHQKNKELVVFWGSWCKECRDKMTSVLPTLNKRSDVAVLAVNMDASLERAQHFIEKEQITIPVAHDSKKELSRGLKVFAVPHWAIYKKDAAGAWSVTASAPSFDLDQIEKELAK